MNKRRHVRAQAADAVRAQQQEEQEEEQEEEEEEEEADQVVAAAASALASKAENRTERRRRQCRISQRRYRDKKGSMEYNLKLGINQLRESVDRLKQARVLLESKIQNDRRLLRQSVLKAVEQYYVMFQFGLHDPDAGNHVRQCYEIQKSFLHAFMDPQVQMGEQSGVDVVLEQWRRYTRYHSSLHCELVSAQVFGSDTGSPIVKATGRLVVTISRLTLERLFPEILQKNESLAELLIGRDVEYTTCTEYMFDEKVQVIRQDLTVDFVAGLGSLLRDPFVMSDLFSKATISDDAMLGPHTMKTDVVVKSEPRVLLLEEAGEEETKTQTQVETETVVATDGAARSHDHDHNHDHDHHDDISVPVSTAVYHVVANGGRD